ncbi:3-phosphoshikimate 1-carboxyvinyltransferase [Carboxylicivirga mesophila]|uniref:3-phosphoshikimate 1-carboxyvinyltransferase n=1 Tax=Carboxylicivirga mesophila TaxID=1166478 RepID=A0ABS5K6E6_9BACT|nr:3-phosphoshikimate 1-carboxyvinyltransferase [Carboxylicivirga mesophila]MBS2210482.1 3-phosphoshikimate 1-carboxyvinyltransferase [Carboxylicivirga mesophila]
MHYQLTTTTSSDNIQVQLPSSKSISNRLLLLNALSYSPYEIKNLSDSDDTKAMLGVLNSNTNTFDVGAAGTSMRFLTAFLSKIVGEWTLTGSERMKQRPIKTLVDALNKLGAKIEYMEKEGYPPLRIFGSNLEGGELELPGNVSSQYISALLMIAPTIENGLKLTLTGEIISRPYLEMTLALMKDFGVTSHWKGNVITVPEAPYQPKVVTAESDWSAASYWYEMVALNPSIEVTLKGLKKISLQGDSQVQHMFDKLGVKTKFSQKGTTLTNTGKKPGRFNYNFINEPDLAQTLAVTCCLMDIPFHFTGLQTLKIKETDRINALINELKKLGYQLSSNDIDDLKWDGERAAIEQEAAVTIDTYKDHRMAMAFAPAAFKYVNLVINDPMVVTKSYPNYWDDIALAGISFIEG